MKLLLLAKTHTNWQNGVLIYDEMLRQGYDVKICELTQPDYMILDVQKIWQPDWIMQTGAGAVNPEFLKVLKQKSKIAIWDADGIWPAKQKNWDALKGIPNVIISSSRGKAEYLKGYADKAVFIPQYWDSRSQGITEEVERKKATIFIGSVGGSSRRTEWVPKLSSEIDLTVYGNVPELTSKHIYGHEMANAYASHKISFDIQREYVTPLCCGTSDRMYKAMGCGCLYITYPIEGIEEMFIPGEHFVTYNGTYDDLVNKIKYYLNNNTEREKIAKKGQEEIFKNHTLEVRVKQYWDTMENF